MKNGSYHKQVYWPEKIDKQIQELLNKATAIEFSPHALSQAQAKNIVTEKIKLADITLNKAFEVEVKNDKVV